MFKQIFDPVKNVRGNELVDGIHQVARGQSLLDPAVTTRVVARLRGDMKRRSPNGRRGSAVAGTPHGRA